MERRIQDESGNPLLVDLEGNCLRFGNAFTLSQMDAESWRNLKEAVDAGAALYGGSDQRLNHNLYAKLVALAGGRRVAPALRSLLMALPVARAMELNGFLQDIEGELSSAKRPRPPFR
jgi:hypothetical protein